MHARTSACLRVYPSISQYNGPHLSLDVVGYCAEANEHISAGIDYPVHILYIYISPGGVTEVSYGRRDTVHGQPCLPEFDLSRAGARNRNQRLVPTPFPGIGIGQHGSTGIVVGISCAGIGVELG